MFKALLNLGDEDRIRLNQVNASRVKRASEHYNKPLGTTQFVWPDNIPAGKYVLEFDFPDRVELTKQSRAKKSKRVAKSHPIFAQYYGWDFNINYCKSIPKLLNLITCKAPSYRFSSPQDQSFDERTSIRYPLRNVMDGDDPRLIDGSMSALDMPLSTHPDRLRHACVFCGGHLDSDECTQYSTPAERMKRFRDINFTLMRNHCPQICPGCHIRDATHPYSEHCMKKKVCVYCGGVGHNSSMCNSVPHAILRATSFSPDMEDYLNEDLLQANMMRDKKCLHEQADKISLADDKISDLHTEDFCARTSEKLAINQIKEQNERFAKYLTQASGTMGASCVDSQHLDVHYDEYVFNEIVNIKRLFHGKNFAQLEDRYDISKNVSDTLTKIFERLECSRENCTSGVKASHFCSCGLFGLCPCCLLGTNAMIFKLQSQDVMKCPLCRSTISVPEAAGVISAENYLDIIEVAKVPMWKLKPGLSAWVFSVSPNDVFKSLIEAPANLLRNMFHCSKCNELMDSESRVCFKSQCDCGHLICRDCYLTQAMDTYVVDSKTPVPRCYSVLTKVNIWCAGCNKYIPEFGMCAGLTLLAVVCRMLVGGRDTNYTATLNTMFDSTRAAKFGDTGCLTPPPLSPINDNLWCSPDHRRSGHVLPALKTARRNIVDSAVKEVEADVSHPTTLLQLKEQDNGSVDLNGANTSMSSTSITHSQWDITLVAIDQVIVQSLRNPKQEPNLDGLEDLVKGYSASDLEDARNRLHHFIVDDDIVRLTLSVPLVPMNPVTAPQQSAHNPLSPRRSIDGNRITTSKSSHTAEDEEDFNAEGIDLGDFDYDGEEEDRK